jgi:diguanylate cyclase (GGDEF)-like protein
MFTVQYLSTGSLEAKAIATGAADQLIKNHEFLLRYHTRQGREMSAPLDALYFDAASNIDDQVNEFVTEVNRLLSEAPFESERTGEIYDLTFFQMAQDKLLFDFNAIVQQYEDESASRISELQLVQRIVLFIVILTLIIEALFVFRPMVRKISSFAQRLQHDANFDSLSGVFNRRAFDQLANRAFKLASRHKHSFSVVVADIDFFKRVNDTFGHAAGDQVIKLAGQLLAINCRDTDVVARVGGEEFTIILPNTPLESAENVAHKLKCIFRPIMNTHSGRT